MNMEVKKIKEVTLDLENIESYKFINDDIVKLYYSKLDSNKLCKLFIIILKEKSN